MPPAARLGDMHQCPEKLPRRHIGGPVLPPCCPKVFIYGKAAARVGDLANCIGVPVTDPIVSGAATVFIYGKPAARVEDPTSHGGKIVVGCPTVFIH